MLLYLFAVALNETTSGIDDGLSGAVVAFELEEASIGIVLAKVEDVVDVRPPETVDALCIVAHDTDTLPLVGEEADDLMLSKVGILILIDEDEMEALLPMCCHFKRSS